MNGTCTDIELVKKLKRNDSNAFKEIFEKYWESLFASALKRLNSQDLCEDIIQEVFADIWKRRAGLKITTNLKVYLHTAVKYQVFKIIGSKQWNDDIDALDHKALGVFQESLEFDELYGNLEIALDKLPKRQQLIFRMSRLEGLKSKEIAKQLNLSEQTVFNNLHKSLRVLRSELKDYAPALLLVSFLM